MKFLFAVLVIVVVSRLGMEGDFRWEDVNGWREANMVERAVVRLGTIDAGVHDLIVFQVQSIQIIGGEIVDFVRVPYLGWYILQEE